MSESAAERQQKLVNELRATANLMTLDNGLFCIVCNPSRAANAVTGLPGVRVSLPPGPAGRPEAVSISTFRDDGWLGPFGDAALVRVVGGPAVVMITVYQAPDAPEGGAPNVQVIRLTEAPAAPVAAPAVAPRVMDMVAHIQGRGDVGGMLGERLGEAGSGRWIEGFGIAPTTDVAVEDIEYQAVLGRDWLSPWVDGGQFCGSRGMALPLLGFRLRLRGKAAEAYDCTYEATFVDGSSCGPVAAGAACQAESLAALESVLVTVTPRGAVPAPAPVAAQASAAKKPAPAKADAKKAEPKHAEPKKAELASPATNKPASNKPRRGSAKPK